jgi:hypothetical protein
MVPVCSGCDFEKSEKRRLHIMFGNALQGLGKPYTG